MASPLGQRLDNGSSSEAIQQQDTPRVGRSYFPLSRVHTTSCDVGGIYPMDLIKCVLGDSFDLSSAIMIDSSNPLVKPLMSRVRAYVHYYYSRSTDLWKGYQNHITTGRRASTNTALPYVLLGQQYTLLNKSTSAFTDTAGTSPTDDVGYCNFTTPMALAPYFQLPFFDYINGFQSGYDLTNSIFYLHPYGNFPTMYKFSHLTFYSASARGFTTWNNTIVNGGTFTVKSLYDNLKVNALPFVMYQRIYRDYFLNKNLSQNNKNWFPDDEDDFILPYSTTQAYSILNDATYRQRYQIVPDNRTDSKYWDDTSLLALRFRQWRGDYFTEALPWQYRGDEPIAGASLAKVYGVDTSSVPHELKATNSGGAVSVTTPDTTATITSGSIVAKYDGFTANNIRELFTLAEFKERMAKTNGDYNDLMRSQFGRSPNIHDRRPLYLGGYEIDLNASQIESTAETSGNPLGSVAGRLGAVGGKHVTRFDCPDNGYIMALLSIVPDVVYANQGIPRHMRGATLMSEEYFPLFNNLAPQGITKSEVMYAGVSPETTLFGWIDRFMDYKTRQNYVSGLVQLPTSVDTFYSSRVWIRRFNDEVALNNAFVTCAPPTVDRSIFSSPTDPAFIVQFASKVEAVRPMPFKTQPASLNGFAM